MRNHVPDGWTSAAFGDVLSHRKESGDAGEELLSVTSEEGVILQSESGRRNISSEDKSSYNRVHPGDIVYNTMRMWQGVSGTSNHSGIVSPAYTVCTPKDSIDSLFLAYLLKHPDYVRRFRQMSQGLVSDTWNLKFREFANTPLLLPPLNEQRKIAEALGTLDETSRLHEEAIAKLGAARVGLVMDLLTETETHGKIPLSQVSQINSGLTLGSSHAGIGKKFPYLRVANVQDGFLDLSDVKDIELPTSATPAYRLRSGDVLMTEGGDFDKLGRGVVWRGEINECLYQNHIFRVRCNKSALLPEFLATYSSSWHGKNYFRLASKQSTNLASINSTQLKSFPVPMAPLEEQRRIVSIIETHDERISVERARLEKLRKLKAGLMDDLLTGRVRVDQLEDLPV